MKNNIFNITFNNQTGLPNSIMLLSDKNEMNWCHENAEFGCVRIKSYDYDNWYKSFQKKSKLISFKEDDTSAESIFLNGGLQVTINCSFDKDENFVQHFTFKNLAYADLFLNESNCSIEIPFNDKYTYADDCLVHNCNTHIWCGGNTTYINALKMGISENNLGLVVIKGSFESYSVDNCETNIRGNFMLNLKHAELIKDEEYEIEWVIFPHKGNNDFYKKAKKYSSFIEIKAEHFTFFGDETIKFSAELPNVPKSVKVFCDTNNIDFEICGNEIKAEFKPQKPGEYRVFVEADKLITWADFTLKPDFETILKKRIDFIIDNQQYHKDSSPLNGAFLIFDNKKQHMIFEDNHGDHNACRERIGMALLIAKYLQSHENQKFYVALMKYIEFLEREFYNHETGFVYNTIGKDEKQIRLYNAPWVSMFFTEMYYLTKDKKYLKRIIKLFENYYNLGGEKFYPNGISISRTLAAFKNAEMRNEYDYLYQLFKTHVDNMVKNNTSYPAHEVNYEQTIVSPAATFVSEFAAISGEDKYFSAAKTQIEILERFDGKQPSFHMHEIPIRFWDDYWFGKFMLFGDTFPHYWSCLSARSYNDYYKISKNEYYLKKAEECMRNCMCLFSDDGKGSAAYIYPYKSNGEFGEKYDDWANDQDFALYFALETGLIQ